MKNLSTILSIIAILGVGYLAFFQNKNKGSKARAKVINSADLTNGTIAPSISIAYVDLDTLEDNYTEFKKKKQEFEATDKRLGEELQRLASALQGEAIELEKKAQAGQVNKEQYEAAMMNLQRKQQNIETKKQNDGSALIKKQDDFNISLQNNIRGFLEDYASEKGYDYVLAYTKTSTILFANPDLDITEDVIDALNSGKNFAKKDDAKKDAKEATKDTSKTKK